MHLTNEGTNRVYKWVGGWIGGCGEGEVKVEKSGKFNSSKMTMLIFGPLSISISSSSPLYPLSLSKSIPSFLLYIISSKLTI